MSALQSGQKTLNAIKEEMQRIDALCREAQDMIDEFPSISRVSRIHKNFGLVEDMKTGLQGLDRKLAMVDRMLQEDEGDELDNPMMNLIPIHHALTQLRNFRDEAMAQSQNADDDVKQVLEQYFSPLQDRIDMFDERLGIIGMSLVELVKAGNHGLVVRTAKIIDAEERSDDRVEALRAAMDSQRELRMTFDGGRGRQGGRQVRGYKTKFFSCISASVEAKFSAVKELFAQDPEGLADSLAWYFDDLYTVKEEFPRLMPPKWDIWNTMLGVYHKGMYDFLKEIAATPELDGQSLLTIILWVSEYNKQMKALGIKASELQPRLFDGNEAGLVKEYLHLITSSMERWMQKIIDDDTAEFTSREKPTDMDETGKSSLQGPVIMFQMINQQLEVALDSNKGSVVAGVVDETVRLLIHRQQTWEKVISSEVDKYLVNPEAVPEGLLEYIIAVANDQIKCANYTEATSQKTASLLSAKYAAEVSTAFDSAIDGFLTTATACLTSIQNIIFLDLRPAFAALFTPSWYEGGHIASVVSTFGSYIEDPLAPTLDTDLFVGLVEQLSAATVVAYLSAIVRNKGAKVNYERSIGQIRADVTVAYAFFTDFLPPEVVKGQWFALEHFMKLISAPTGEQLKAEVERFREKYWDVDSAWLESVVKAREDYRKEFLEAVRSGRGGYGRGEKETIMGKVGR